MQGPQQQQEQQQQQQQQQTPAVSAAVPWALQAAAGSNPLGSANGVRGRSFAKAPAAMEATPTTGLGPFGGAQQVCHYHAAASLCLPAWDAGYIAEVGNIQFRQQEAGLLHVLAGVHA